MQPSPIGNQGLPIGVEIPTLFDPETLPASLIEISKGSRPKAHTNGDRNGNGNGRSHSDEVRDSEAAAGITSTIVTPIVTPGPTQYRGTSHYGIVVFSHLRWGFVWQRPQQFLSRFARKHRILFIEEPFFDVPNGGEARVEYHQVMPNVTVVAPHLPPTWRHEPHLWAKLREYTHNAIVEMNEAGDFDRPLLWYYSPMDSAWSLGHFENRGIVYDCMDELSQFTGAPPALSKNEARLMQYADVVFTGGFELGDKKRLQHSNVHAFGCGVEVDHFGRATEPTTIVPPDIDFLPRPILGWFGVVDERVDYAMVGEMARLRPEWSFAMIGPVVKVDPNHLPHFPNLYWLGGRDYDHLPNYCKAFDVCMMPFAINAATQFINPTKALEYMATGKPIVGTPVRDVVRQWTDIVRIAPTFEEFIRAVEDALGAGPADPRIVRGLELARRSSWDSTVSKLEDLVTGAIVKSDRPSSARLQPLSDTELDSIYTATQGS